jgi:RNA polymerase sigma factor (sigma-70 family)
MEKKKNYYVHNDDVLDILKDINSKKEFQPYIDDLMKKISYMVNSKIKRYHGRPFYEDLLQEIRIGILNAIKNFDRNRGINFFKFADWHIKNRIRKFMRWNYRGYLDKRKEKVANVYSITPEFSYEEKEKNTILMDAINKLSDIERRIIILKFGITNGKEHTYDQLGKKFCLSKQRIEQIKNKAISKLQKNTNIKKFFNLT